MRPLERRILAMVEAGTDFAEIARRFRRSPEFISRVVEIARLPHAELDADEAGPAKDSSNPASGPSNPASGSGSPSPDGPQLLRPIERLVLKSRAAGVPMDLMARQIKRSTAHLERIADLAAYKLGNRSD
ncbi:MAG: hypothetical protein ACYCS7_15890 [Acidimicrobiales bacterium]